jgi:hypothetical protein
MTTEKTKLTYTDETNNIVVLEECEEVCRGHPIYQTFDKQSKIDCLLLMKDWVKSEIKATQEK